MDAASMSRALPQLRCGEKNSGEKPKRPFRQNGMNFENAGWNPNQRRMRGEFSACDLKAREQGAPLNRGLNRPTGKPCACGGSRSVQDLGIENRPARLLLTANN
jgi:hypothetical protein